MALLDDDSNNKSKAHQKLEKLRKAKAESKIDKNGYLTFNPSPFFSSKDINKKPIQSNGRTVLSEIQEFLDRIECNNMEAIYKSSNKDKIFNTFHGFISSAVTAWSQHYPLIIKPSHIWLLILQAVSIHVEQHAEKLRSKWVIHGGQKSLTIVRNDFVKGSENNDWESVIKEFVKQIDENSVENVIPLLNSNYSTSTNIDNIACKVTIMDICKQYFSYTVMTECGFPSIHLHGIREDWVLLKKKSEMLLNNQCEETFALSWSKCLLPILDRFINAYDGDIDCLFWNSMVKRGASFGSGSTSWYSGWINIFFPFESEGNENPYCVPYDDNNDYVKIGLNYSDGIDGLNVDSVPIGLATAPVNWIYYGEEISLTFVAGFMGAKQHPESLAIEPNIGWFIASPRTQRKGSDNE